jgi:hypothetical protein
MNQDPVQVKVVYSDVGHDGPGWYVWEVDMEDEGYVYFSTERPTTEQLQAICLNYTEEEQS